MSLRDEIDRVILEEAKSDERKKRVMDRRKPSTPARGKDYRTRFQKPTYFAVLIGKLLYRFKRPQGVRKAVTPTRGIEGYVEQDFVERPQITIFTIIKEDLHNLPKRFLMGGKKKRKRSDNNFPKSNETIDDWKEFFEKDNHSWQGGRKYE